MKVKIGLRNDLYLDATFVVVNLDQPNFDFINSCVPIDLYSLRKDGLLNNLISKIEECVNLCLEKHESELLQTLDNIVKKYEPKLKEFKDFIKGA